MDLDDERLNSSNEDIWGPYHEFVDPFSVLVFQRTSNILQIHIYPVLYISRVNYWHSSLLVIITGFVIELTQILTTGYNLWIACRVIHVPSAKDLTNQM